MVFSHDGQVNVGSVTQMCEAGAPRGFEVTARVGHKTTYRHCLDEVSHSIGEDWDRAEREAIAFVCAVTGQCLANVLSHKMECKL